MTAKCSILIIDDDKHDRFLFKEFLSRANDVNYMFEEANTGDMALLLYEQRKYDCVLLDFMMHGMTGIEFLEHLQEKNIALIPTIFISNHLNPLIIERAKELGIAAYLEKSDLTSEILHKTVSQLV